MEFENQRTRLLDEIKSEVAFTASMTGINRLSHKIIQSIEQVPREAFVPSEFRHFAYDNRPLPIGNCQTISQPYIVALMTELLNLSPDHKVLEIGTGCGYQSAILSNLVDQVYSVEKIAELSLAAKKRLHDLGYRNVTLHIGDGHLGLVSNAPYDAIMVTAAAEGVPKPLIAQLKTGGRLIIPIGKPHYNQELILIEKISTDDTTSRAILPVVFVPLVKE